MSDKPDLEMGKTFTALVRIHEANCQLDFPNDQETNFRLAIMKALARQLGLDELFADTQPEPGETVELTILPGEEYEFGRS